MKRHHRTRESWEKWAALKRNGLPWTILEVTEVTADGKLRCGYDEFDGRPLGEKLETIEPGKMYKI